jgi:hypothetical protein
MNSTNSVHSSPSNLIFVASICPSRVLTSNNEAKIRALYLKLRPNGYLYTEVFDEVEYYNDEVDERNYMCTSCL